MDDFEFDCDQTQWSAFNALWCAKASQLAYADGAQMDATLKGWGFSQLVSLNCRETSGFVAGNDKMVLVAFRGTEPEKLRDWMTDVDIPLVDFLGGKAHAGFARAITYVWDDMLAAIKSMQTNAQSLWFTGHSLGAALATLAAARLRLESDTAVNGLYTFGSPRVGDADLAMRFNQDFRSRNFRYVNNADVVTRVASRALGYRDVGTFLFFDKTGSIQSDMHWWNLFLNTVEGNMDDLLSGKVAPLDDHFIANYIANAEKNLGANPFA
jgi:triacylglycerol lipase